MKIFRNSEIKRLTFIFIFFITIIVLLSFVTTSLIINNYNNYYINYNAKVLSIIERKYPNVEEEIIKEIQNSNDKIGKDILKKYGITDNETEDYLSPIKNEFNRIFMYQIIESLLIYVLLIIIVFIFLRKIYEKIRRLNDYTLNIAYSDYKIDIRDNSEGDISILKNHLYDITRILKENNEMLEKDKSYLKDAIADISHQLKTPLTSLYLFNEILEDEKDETKRKYFLDKMRNELERIEWLITSLLKMSKLDSKTIVLKEEKINVPDLINSSIDSLKTLIEQNNIKINIRGKKQINFIGDFYWMKEALMNVLKNGVEHSKTSGSIEIAFDKNPIYTIIEITDNGEGIAESDLPYIFDRFYKAKGSSKNSVGIGLALSKSIIKNQNGEISVKSKIGEYTKFIIKIYQK
jgi:signal transduction histidine kinase